MQCNVTSNHPQTIKPPRSIPLLIPSIVKERLLVHVKLYREERMDKKYVCCNKSKLKKTKVWDIIPENQNSSHT